MSRRRALFFVNRHSRNGAAFAHAAGARLRKLGFDLIDMPERRGRVDTAALARNDARRPRLAIIGGGDGTLNLAIDTLARLRITLGILPLGTANDLARTLGVPTQLQAACEVIAAGHTREIDLGSVNGRYFLNDVSVGLSARVASSLTRSAKKRWGVFAAVGTALRAVTRARRFHVDIRVDRERVRAGAYQLTIGNGIYLGGVVKNADASIDDGRLDMYLLENKDPGRVAAMLPFAAAGRYDANPYVLTIKGKRFTVTTKRPMRMFTDGEPAGTTPARIAVAPKALRVVVPRRPAS